MTYHQLKYLLWSVVVGVTLSLTSCMKWDYGDAVEDFNATLPKSRLPQATTITEI